MKILILSVATLGIAAAFAQGETTSDRNKWRFSIGGAFNGRVKSSISTRNLPTPASAYAGTEIPQGTAWNAAKDGDFGDQGFIHNDDDTTESQPYTSNWKLNKSAEINKGTKTGTADYTSEFRLENRYEELDNAATVFGGAYHNSSDDKNQFGVSVELSRELWVHEMENEDDHNYGLDFAAAFSYFFGRDIYRTSGVRTRTDTVNSGSYVTTVKDGDATWDYDNEGTPLGDGEWFGAGSSERAGGPALDLRNVVGPTLDENAPTLYNSALPYSAKGDYQELEMLFMLRPWYDVTDWWRVFVEGGVGVSWGRFDSSFSATGVSHDEDFDQWDCYGVAGVGTAFSYGDYSLAVDFLGRFLRDDLDVNGRYVRGSIDRADWGIRLMLGYSF